MSVGLKLTSAPPKETPLAARDFSPYTNNGGYVNVSILLNRGLNIITIEQLWGVQEKIFV